MKRAADEWRPAARIETLRLRAELLRRTREYFAVQGVTEVDTPVLSRAAVTDVHLESLKTAVAGYGDYFLQTSPEYAMKRLIAAGSGDLYQIAKVFRDGERGRWHNPEFTMIEWYRLNFSALDLMRDAERLLHTLLAERRLGSAQILTYQEAMLQYAHIDPFTAPIADLKQALQVHQIPLPVVAAAVDLSADRNLWLDLLMSSVVGPRLGAGALTFIHDYPASQAALARLNPADERVAERFEIYLEGVELANGFHELSDAVEQRKRFEDDLRIRRSRELASPPLDERLLAALNAGLPDCAGVAVGFDRVMMLAANASQIDEVLTFPIERA